MGYLRRHPLIAACAILAAILVVVLGFETGFGTGIRSALPPPSGKPAVAADARVLPPVMLGSVDQAFPESAARPLFIPTRRPAPSAAVAGGGPMAKGSFTLQGVIVARGVRIAMLREKASGRIHRVEQGKEVNGMTVAQIEPDRVVLRQGEDQEMVVMTVQKGGGVGGVAAQGPFPGAGSATPSAQPAPSLPASFGGPSGQPGAGAHSEAPAAPGNATPAPPAQAAPVASGQTNATGPMTPEELLARRRARRNQQ